MQSLLPATHHSKLHLVHISEPTRIEPVKYNDNIHNTMHLVYNRISNQEHV